MSAVKVFVDADVLHKLCLRKLIFTLHEYEVVKVLWTKEVSDESLRSLTRRFPDKQVGLYRMFQNYRTHFFDTEVTKFQHLIGRLGCEDPNDEHVLAGAMVGRASHLLTFNSSDFPANTKEVYGLVIGSPDEVLAQLLKLNQNTDEILAHWLSLFREPLVSAASGANAMAKGGCPQLANLLKDRATAVDLKLIQLRGRNLQ